MSLPHRILRSILPAPARRALRERHRQLVFDRAMRRFLADPARFVAADDPVILDLIYGWGNEQWSALGEYLSASLRRALEAAGPTLECGSGLSTLLVGAIAARRGNTHWALEHIPEWGSRVQGMLDRYGIRSVVLSVSPLKDYGEYCWYQPPLGAMPAEFSLVLCDGPPASTRGGRYGLVPVMRERLHAGCVILLDDAARQAESAVGRRWAAELAGALHLSGSAKPYMELVVGAGGNT